MLRFPDFRPFPYHPIGFNVEVVGVVGPLLTEDAGDSVLESSSFLSLRDFVRFFFFRFFRLLSSLGVTFLSLDCLRDFKASSLRPFSLALSWFVSSSPLPSSDDESELDEDDDEDDESEDDEDEEVLEFEELDEEPEDPERDFFVLCFLLLRFLGLGFLEGSQQSQ